MKGQMKARLQRGLPAHLACGTVVGNLVLAPAMPADFLAQALDKLHNDLTVPQRPQQAVPGRRRDQGHNPEVCEKGASVDQHRKGRTAVPQFPRKPYILQYPKKPIFHDREVYLWVC